MELVDEIFRFKHMNKETKTNKQVHVPDERVMSVNSAVQQLKDCVDVRIKQQPADYKAYVTATVDLFEEQLKRAGLL